MEQKRLLARPIAYAMFLLTGFLFVFCFVTGRELAVRGNILWTFGHTFQILGISFLFGGIIGAVICMLFYRWAEKTASYTELKEKTGGAKLFGISLLLNFIAWIPGFLAYYPAVCAYDIPVQLEQILSGRYIDHHPIFHTLLIKGTMDLGEHVFGSVNAGIAFYALLQMLFLSAAFAFGIRYSYQHGMKRVGLAVLQILCMLYPFHVYMSISVTKDTLFSAFFVVTVLALSELIEGKKACVPLFFVSGTLMILFRNNGKYAFLVLLVFLAAAFAFDKGRRAFRGRLFLLAVGTFLVGNLLLSGIFKAVGAEQGDKREMLSIPIQQLSRTILYHGGIGVLKEDDGAMSDEDRALINDFILDEAYRDYRPDFTDPVKSYTNTYVVRYRAKDFLTSYVGLFLQFPGDYLNAALAVDAGYLYPGDVSHAYINAQEGDPAGGGYVQTRWDEERLREADIHKDTKWPGLWRRMEKWADDNAYLQIPLFKYLFVPGVWIWLYLLLAGWYLINRRFAKCIPLALVFGYFLTLLLGPAVQLRYLYPVMAVFPFLLGAEILPENKK